MRTGPADSAHDTGTDDPDELTSLLAAWKRSLRAQRTSPATLRCPCSRAASILASF